MGVYKWNPFQQAYFGLVADDKPTVANEGVYLYEFDLDTGVKKIYQCPDGTNWVEVDNESLGTVKLEAGTNLIGKVGIDQVTANANVVKENFKTREYSIPRFQISTWNGFSNQPANQGVELISNNVGDVGKCTVIGTTFGTNNIVLETVQLNALTAVPTVKTDWGNILGVMLCNADGTSCVQAIGTVTCRRANDDAAICTVAASKLSTGLIAFNIVNKNFLFNVKSGQVWFSTVSTPTTANVADIAAGDSFTEKVASRIMFISNASAAECVAWVFSD
jgi:hypothetical protein